jgi:hypothetical protein
MSIPLPHDPRTALVRTKYFSLHPKPLERWLWRQGLPQAAERVFWLHWEEGMRSGDWSSEIPIKRVARECAIDPSTVTRAYQLLKSLGLVKREDPGRNPANPFCQATAITEVRLPRDLVVELFNSPNRPCRDHLAADSEQNSRSDQRPNQPPAIVAPAAATPRDPDSTHASRPSTSPDSTRGQPTSPDRTRASRPSTNPDAPVNHRRPNRDETSAMWGRASATERSRFYAASRDRLTALEFDAETKLTPADRGHILAQLAQLAAAKPPKPIQPATPRATPSDFKGPRRLSVLELARARRRILELVPTAAAAEVFRQVIWAVEEGALRRFAATLALNIALKKIREGAWTTPNRMPPQWMPQSTRAATAVPEYCGAA